MEKHEEIQEQVRDGIITNIAKACPAMLGCEALNLADKILQDEKAQGVVIQTGVLKVRPDKNLVAAVDFPVVWPLTGGE